MSDIHDNDGSHDEAEENPSNDNVMNKYKTAGEIANSVLKKLISMCVESETIVNICEAGDKAIEESVSKVFVKYKSIKKGVAFPTCVSINNVICHMSPLKSDPANQAIKTGDVVKIDLGVHIDGYVSCLATTLVVGASKESPICDRRADVIMAGRTAAELVLKKLRADNTNHMVTDLITEVAKEFGCHPVEGITSYNTTRGVLEGDIRIMLHPSDQMKKDYTLSKFEQWQVYCVDIFMSTGEEAKPKTRDTRTTVFRRSNASYNLKMKISRETLNHATTTYGEFGFSLRSFDDENKVRLGIKECVDHQLLISYPVMYEKEGEYVSHFKFTVVIGPNGPIKIAFPPFSHEGIKSQHKIRKPELLQLMNEPLVIKTKNNAIKETKNTD